jgi:hypothetical protein
MMRPLSAVLVSLSVSVWGTPVSAQQAPQTVADIVDFLVTNRAVQTGDFERDRAAAEQAREAISRALLLNLTTVPLASSSSGFLYRLNPMLGTMERATQSFGSFFVERALTAGAGQGSIGISVFGAAFDRLGDLHLRDGSLITVANQFRDEPSPFDIEALTLKVRSTTLTLFGSVGVTDRLEIGATLPLISLAIEGERVNTYRGDPLLQASGQATASGVGDAAVRAKFMIARTSAASVSAAAEVRLPTGSEENLLGAGAASYRILGIGSLERGRLTLLGNGGIARGGVSSEVNLAGAAAIAVRPQVTVSGELLVRRVSDLEDLSLVSQPHPVIDGVDTMRLLAGERGITLATAVTGIKWNVNRTFVLAGHVTFPLARRGLTAPITPTLALEYAF